MERYAVYVGGSRRDTTWKRREWDWHTFASMLGECRRTSETVAQYKAMTKPQRADVKDVGGFVGGILSQGRRKADSVTGRSLITLDIDSGRKDTPELVKERLAGTAWCIYSTHSHTPEAPRFRLVIPLSREVSPDEYEPIARKVADEIGLELFDRSTFEPSRLMYWPSASKDGEFIHLTGEGAPLDADEALASYSDWTDATQWPEREDAELPVLPVKHGPRQEDPTAKQGIIGAFCRSYGITAAIEAFLPEVYVPTAHPDRWTYAQGTTTGGLVVYDDKWAYSHHGTDPCCGRLCNAFDLVRLHLYGKLDKKADPDAPVATFPSFKAMEKAAKEDRRVLSEMADTRLREAAEDFAGLLEDDRDKMKQALIFAEKRGNKGELSVYMELLKVDPLVKKTVRYNEMSGRVELVADLPWRKRIIPEHGNSYEWEDTDDTGLLVYMEEHYKIRGSKKADLQAALEAVAAFDYGFHPLKEYLDGLKWDGRQRLDTLLVDYLGAKDTPVARAMTRKHFTAAVARVMAPGCKYDYVLTLIGPEGIGKSSLIRVMAKKNRWFSDSLTSIEGKEAMDLIRGRWLIEMGELLNYKKATSEAYKAFISKQDDKYRRPYDRHQTTVFRQCVFFATTNEGTFLKGSTGNRRFWVIDCGKVPPVKDVFKDLPGEVDQIWAEAVERWKAGEELYLDGALEVEARRGQDDHNEAAGDDRQGVIEDFLQKPLPANWNELTIEARRGWFRYVHEGEPVETIQRQTVSAVEVLCECFGEKLDERTKWKTRDINQLLRRIPWVEDTKTTRRISGYGTQRIYLVHHPEGGTPRKDEDAEPWEV